MSTCSLLRRAAWKPEQRGRLLGDERLGVLAAGSTPEQFEQDLRHRVRELQTDDGIGRFEQQRRAVRFRSWTERDSGMIRFTCALDPEIGIRFLYRIRAATEEVFHDTLPDACPTDPLVKQEHLQGLALVALSETGGSGRRGVTELVVTIDAKTLNSGMQPDSRVSTRHVAVELPLATIRRQAYQPTATPHRRAVSSTDVVAAAELARRRRRGGPVGFPG